MCNVLVKTQGNFFTVFKTIIVGIEHGCIGRIRLSIPHESVYSLRIIFEIITVSVAVTGVGVCLIVLTPVIQTISIGIEHIRVTVHINFIDTTLNNPDGPTHDLNAVNQTITVSVLNKWIS